MAVDHLVSVALVAPRGGVVRPGRVLASSGQTIAWENGTREEITVYLPPHGFLIPPSSAVTVPPGGTSQAFRIGARGQDRGAHHYAVHLDRSGQWAEGESEPAVIVK
jgi:hypothetical protein